MTSRSQGLEYEASEMHRRALIGGVGLCSESKMVNSAVVQREKNGQEQNEKHTRGCGEN